MTNYTFDNALADLTFLLERETKEVTRGDHIEPEYLADGFSLVERCELRVHAVLMSQGNLDVLLADHAKTLDGVYEARGVMAKIWGADIFCPLMPDDVVYFIARYEEDADSVEPAMWSQLNLDGIEAPQHSAYDKKGQRVA